MNSVKPVEVACWLLYDPL